MQKHRGGRVDVFLGDLPGAAEPALSLVQIAMPPVAPRAGARIGWFSKP
jgi:hypothetical protein